MVVRLDDNPGRFERCLQVWQILTSRAMNTQVITFYRLGCLLGVEPHRVHLSLAPVAAFCVKNELPNLSSLVIKVMTGDTGYGYPLDLESLEQSRIDVFNFRWFAILPPTKGQLEEAFQQHQLAG